MEVLKKTAALRVQKQVEGRQPEDVAHLSLSGVPVLPELWAPYTHLTHLLLVSMKPKLTSLCLLGLDRLQSLRLLDVSDNAVSVATAPPAVPSLVRLLMPNNHIESLAEVLRLSKCFPKLEVLDVADNAVDTPENFSSVFDAFPMLAALNSRTSDGAEVIVEESDESSSEEDEDEDDSDSEESTTDAESDSGSDAPPPKRVRAEDAGST
ncbi:hypothetical protein NESM_000821900 [Novymonas esmeraldas]|uniref:Uncharacterized protein n=1 Tax=Novymonas esmeraldas TaxID=1808958 RepID=A0AAW0EZ66_9TRYP